MRFLISGEGQSDVGTATRQGPMRILLDVLAQQTLDVEVISQKTCDYAKRRERIKSNETVSDVPKITIRKHDKRSLLWKAPHDKLKKTYWYYDVRTLAQYAREKASAPYGLVWFQDCDTNDHLDICQSARAGFKTEGMEQYGVPMLPKPCSEAWLLAHFQNIPYHDCAQLESLDGVKSKPNSPSSVLARFLGCTVSEIYKVIADSGYNGYDVVRAIDWDRVEMPSFNQFKTDFLAVVKRLEGVV